LDGSQRIQLSYPPLAALLPSWSPDGEQIAFHALLPGKKVKLYTVATVDGTRIAFGGALADPNTAIRILDVGTHQVSTLPGSKGFFSPRWSPDGRYIVGMPSDSRSLVLFDFASQKWEEIAKITLGFPNWSKSGDYVYFLHEEDQPSVMRVRIRDRKLERVADLKNFRQAGFYGVWLGMAPDDSPLLLRDTGTQEIYALDWQAP
jgi:eukaryotic-like serine/threonine-protein kinase